MSEYRPSENLKKWLFMVLQVMIVILAMAIGYFGHRFILQNREDLGLLKQARQILIENAIMPLPSDRKLQHGMIRGMLGTLEDPYTYFVEPAAHEVQSDELTGSFGGIGVRLERDTEMNWRLYPMPDSPAIMAGIGDGDFLIGVDGMQISSDTDDLSLIAAVRGPVGEKVEIKVQRGSETLNFTIERQDVPLPSVSWNILPEDSKLGMIKINRIAESTADEIKDAVQDLQDQGAEALILDLRDNGGGLVKASVEIAELFLSEGVIVHEKFRDKGENIYEVNSRGDYTDILLVLLINGNTGSSAEILAGALKNHQRAPLIGSRTYSKTSIQYIFDLEDGSSIHITSGEWWIPGITFPLEPDYAVADDPSGVAALEKAIEILHEE